MEFRKDVRSMELLTPSLQFGRQVELIEYREDPLTGSQSRINVQRAGRARQAQWGEADLSQAIERTAVGCFFCPANIEGSTPKFPPKICPDGRIRRGESLVFPNLFPFAEYHAVGTLTKRHFLDLDGFTPGMLVDNIVASREYISLVSHQDEKVKYPMYIWNYLPPSAASIIHPHVQVVLDRDPTPELEKLLERSEEYFRRHGVNYWRALIEVEKEIGERYIGENDSLAVIASYAPRGNREVQMIFKGVGNLADLDERQTVDFATAITSILHCYKKMGVNSFNLATYSAPVAENPDYYWLNARMISRPFFQPFYTSDAGFMERFNDVWVIETLPEEVARESRAIF